MIRGRLLRTARLVTICAGLLAWMLPVEVVTAAQKSSGSETSGTTKVTPQGTTTAPARDEAAEAAARRARAARARAQAQARALAEAKQPRFRMNEYGAEVPDVRAEAAIIYNPETGAVLWESNSRNQRSIASITKVMTAVVFLEELPDLERKVVVQRSDVRAASTTYLRAGYTVTGNDLLHLALIGSDNAAARILARISHGGTQPFIARMNQKAQELGLTRTSYADPSGLMAANVSSAYDMARLIAYASTDERIAGVMQKPKYSLAVGRTTIDVRNTNQLLLAGDSDPRLEVQAGKTGFISKAGYCLAALFHLPGGGPPVAVVVLGAQSSTIRFWETRHLFNWMSSHAADLLGVTPLQAASLTPASSTD